MLPGVSPAKVSPPAKSSGAEPRKPASPQVFDIREDEETEPESEDEAFRRRRKTVKPLVLDDPPPAGGLRSWLNELYIRGCASSNRSKHRTLKYLKQVEVAAEIADVAVVPKRWDDFDTELASAMMNIAKGATKREMVLYQESQGKLCLPMSGRAALWIFLHRYHIDRGGALQVDITKLMALEFKGDLESYLDQLDLIQENCLKQPDDDLLHAFIEPQLRKCRALAPEFVTYDRADDGAPERSAQFLYDSARRCVARKRKEDNLAAMKGPLKVAVVKKPPQAPPKKATPPDGGGATGCMLWAKAVQCKFGDKCRYPHLRDGVHTPTPKHPTAPGATPKLKPPPKSPKPTSEIPCRFF